MTSVFLDISTLSKGGFLISDDYIDCKHFGQSIGRTINTTGSTNFSIKRLRTF